jgi:hypothetical protein
LSRGLRALLPAPWHSSACLRNLAASSDITTIMHKVNIGRGENLRGVRRDQGFAQGPQIYFGGCSSPFNQRVAISVFSGSGRSLWVHPDDER